MDKMDTETQDKIFDRFVRCAESVRTGYEQDIISYVRFEYEINALIDTGYNLCRCAIFDEETQISLVDVLNHIKDTVVRHSY